VKQITDTIGQCSQQMHHTAGEFDTEKSRYQIDEIIKRLVEQRLFRTSQ
jgi:hypothetical protein